MVSGIFPQSVDCDQVIECIEPEMKRIYNQMNTIDAGAIEALNRTEDLHQRLNEFQHAVPLDAQDVKQILENMHIENGVGGGLTEDQVDMMIDDAIDSEIMPMVEEKIENAIRGNRTSTSRDATSLRERRKTDRAYVSRGKTRSAGGSGTRGSSAWGAGSLNIPNRKKVMLAVAAGCLILAIYLYTR